MSEIKFLPYLAEFNVLYFVAKLLTRRLRF
jgi:hypothetical protein